MVEDTAGSFESSTRRKVLASSAGTVILGLSGCAGLGSSNGPDDDVADSITVADFGGGFGDALEAAYWDTFEEEHGIEVNFDRTNSFELIGSLLSGVDTEHDLVGVGATSIYNTIGEDIWHPLRLDNFENLDNFRSEYHPDNWNYATLEQFDGNTFCLPEYVSALGCAHNTDYLSRPESWWDMYNEETNGNIAVYNSTEVMLHIIALHAEKNLNNAPLDPESSEYESFMTPVWDTLSEIDEYVYNWTSSPTTVNEDLSTESAYAAWQLDARTADVAEQSGLPIEYTIPEEGTPASPWARAIPAQADEPQRRAAEMLIDHILQEDTSREFVNQFGYFQTIEFSEEPEAYDELPITDYLDRLYSMDPEVLDTHTQRWTENFNQIIQQ